MLPDPVESASRLWLAYAVLLNITLFLGGMWLIGWAVRDARAAVRARVWASAALGTGVVALCCAPWYGSGRELLPLSWDAALLPLAIARPMISLAAAGTAARYAEAVQLPAAAGQGLVTAAQLLWIGWCLGCAFLAIRIAGGYLALHRIRHRSTLVTDPRWTELISELRTALGIRRHVELRSSPGGGTPLTWGTLRPAILLPAGCESWSAADRRAVLIHELEHVRRNDCVIQLSAQLIAAVLWFQPLLWLTLRRLHDTREEACDARVIAAGISRSDYAECLLRIGDLARLHGPTSTLAVSAGMARPPRLMRRLAAILRAPAPGRARRLRLALLAMPGVLLVVASLGARLSPAPRVMHGLLQHEDWATRAFAGIYLSHTRDPYAVDVLRRELDPLVTSAVRLLSNQPH